MFNISKFFGKGTNGTLLAKDNSAISHNGPWVQAYPNTLLDRWHFGDFSSAEYTISIDLNSENREIVKFIVVANIQTASVVIYARNNLGNNLINITATVNNSFVSIIVDPIEIVTDNIITFTSAGAKVIYTVQYFCNQQPLTI
jgi:hypothetical protein